MRLSDLGEFAILDQAILPKARELGGLVGEDCAKVPVRLLGELIISSDKGNVPLVWSLDDYAPKYEDMGWLTAIAGISDLATSGADPICATNNIIAPKDFLVKDLEDFVSGFCQALRSYGFQHAGGDLSEGNTFSVSATFVGASNVKSRARHKSVSGNVVAIGELGTFAAAFCQAKNDGMSSLSLDSAKLLTKPEIPFKLMSQVHKEGLVVSATDASDGIHTAVRILSKRTQAKVTIDLESLPYTERVLASSKMVGVQKELLAFAWGNWQPVLFISDEDWSRFQELMLDEHVSVLGRYQCGNPSVEYTRNGRNVEFTPKNNEAFGENSYYSNRSLPFL